MPSVRRTEPAELCKSARSIRAARQADRQRVAAGVRQRRCAFVRDDTLMAQRFDAGRLALDGEPVAVAEQLRVAGAPATSGVYAVSQTGVLVYQEGVIPKSALVWLDRGGRELGTLSEPRGFSYVQLARISVTSP